MSAERFYGHKKYGDAVRIEVFGDKELDDLFNRMRTSQQKSVLLSAFRKAAKPLVVEMKNTLMARTRAKASSKLVKSIGVKPDSYLPILKVGARRGGGFGGYHAHLIESGTAERMYTHTKSGKEHRTGRLQATNFFKDAVSSKERQAVGSVQDEIINSFKNFIQRANAKAKT